MIAWIYAFEFEDNGLPVPEPAVTDGKDDRRYSKAPDEKIDSDIPSRVNGAAVALEQCEEEDKRVVEEGEEDLYVKGSCKRLSKADIHVMGALDLHRRFERRRGEGFSARVVQNSRENVARWHMQLTGARGKPSVQSLPP